MAGLALLGTCACAAFNLVLLDVDLFRVLFPGDNVEFDFAAVFKLMQLTVAVGTLVWARHVCTATRLSGALAALGVLSWVLALVPSFSGLLAIVGLLGAAQAVAQVSLLGWGATLPSGAMHAIVLGMGLSGLLLGVLEVATKLVAAAKGTALRMGGLLLALDLLALGLFRTMHADHRPLVPKPTVWAASAVGDAKRPLALIALTGAVSMVVFPGLVAEIDPSPRGWFRRGPGAGWFRVSLHVVFLLGDVFGRLRPPKLALGTLAALATSRLALVPAFVLLAKYDGQYPMVDNLAVLAVGLLAVSNGLLISACAALVPSMCHPSGKEVAGMCVGLAAMLGSACGVCGAFLFKPAHAALLLQFA